MIKKYKGKYRDYRLFVSTRMTQISSSRAWGRGRGDIRVKTTYLHYAYSLVILTDERARGVKRRSP